MNVAARATLALLLATFAWLLPAPAPAAGEAKYAEKFRDPVLDEIKKAEAERKAREDAATAAIRDRQGKRGAKKKSLEFTMDPADVTQRPASPDDFKSAFHFPPVPQDETGGCWCFSGMSFFESEVFRQSGRKVRLSEMYTIYFEYVEKARRFVRERGASRVSLGSEINAGPRMMAIYGIVPLDAYPGLIGTERYEHNPLLDEIQAYLDMIQTTGNWNEDQAIAAVKTILNKYMGEPPATIVYEGKSMTPKAFMDDALQLKPADYVTAISTLSAPFHKRTVLDVPDNWWRSDDYINLPLDEWYTGILQAMNSGHTVGICGDTSEPGHLGSVDVAVIPDFDIPADRIDANARELRIYNESTTDDHCIHIVGHTRLGDHDWFLVKDSSRVPDPGKFWGYIFYRDDYVKLKMLSYMVHKDALEGLLPKAAGEGRAAE